MVKHIIKIEIESLKHKKKYIWEVSAMSNDFILIEFILPTISFYPQYYVDLFQLMKNKGFRFVYEIEDGLLFEKLNQRSKRKNG